MSEGFIIDEAHGTRRVSRWQPGKPIKSIWTGIKQNKAHQLPVATWRCDRCAYLESYATRE
jgi:hypothetical protein